MLRTIRRKYRSINVRMSFIFILIITGLILLSSITLYFVFNNVLKKQITDDLDNVMTQNSWTMNALVNSINQASLYLCTDKSTATVLSTKYSEQIEMTSAISTLKTEYSNHIAIPLNDILFYYCSFFFVDDNLPLAAKLTSDYSFDVNQTNGIFNSSRASTQAWYQKAVGLKGSFYTFILDGDKERIYMARSVSSPYLIGKSKNGFMGVQVFSFAVPQIGEKIDTGKLTPSAMVFLVDAGGTILYSKNAEDLQTSVTQYVPQKLLRNYASNITQSLTYKNKKYIASINTLKYGWYLVALIPDGDITVQMLTLREIILITAFLAIALGVLFSIIFSKKITQPIKVLAATMKSVKSKDYFDVTVTPPSDDEVGVMYESFNNMMRRINFLVDEVVLSSKHQRESELKALQAQINPHFIYNTLDAVNWLALSQGEDEIATMTSSLASIMRFNIKEPGKLVTLSDELENVKNYVSIQQLRYAGSFQVEVDVEPDILSRKTPKLTLQPLVENALIHGIENTDRKGQIIISGLAANGVIAIRIADNGIGANVEELNAYLNDEHTLLKNSNGFGIRNVHQRIRLQFGESYGLRYECNSTGGITAVVTLPYDQKDIAPAE